MGRKIQVCIHVTVVTDDIIMRMDFWYSCCETDVSEIDISGVCAEFFPALEGRAIVNLQMRDTFAALQDINAAINIKPTAELLANRGVIHQASLFKTDLYSFLARINVLCM